MTRRFLSTRTASANAFSALLAGDTEGLDVAWLERHGLAAYAAAAGMRHPRLRQAIATHIKHDHAPALQEALTALRGLRVIKLKGLDYAHRLYPDPALRPMGDHDILVEDFDEAVRRLRALGYRDALVQRGVAAYPGHYAAQLVRGAHNLDVHRSIRQIVRARVPYGELFDRAVDGYLSPIDRLLVHCMHVAAHECVVPLIHYLDLELLLADTPLSADVMARAREWRVLNALAGVLCVRARLRGWCAPGFALLPSAEEVMALARPPRALQLARKALLLDGMRERAGFALYALGCQGKA